MQCETRAGVVRWTLAIFVGLLLLATVESASGLVAQWERYHVTTNAPAEDHVALRFLVTWSGPAQMYSAYYDSNGLVGNSFSWFSANRVHAGTNLDSFDIETEPVASPEGTAYAGQLLSRRGSFDVIVLWTGEVSWSEAELVGDGELTLVEAGPAHAYLGHELEGPAFADATAAYGAAQVSAARTLDFSIDGTLFGWFLYPPAVLAGNLGDATLASPSGVDHCVPPMHAPIERHLHEPNDCLFNEFAGPEWRGPGDYRFTWTGARPTFGDTPVIGWADIPWTPGS